MPSCGLIPLYKALAERHADWQLLRYAFCGVKLSDLSLRGPNGAVAISQDPTESWESHRRNRNCLPEIAPQGHFLALRAQGATSACGLLAMTSLPPCVSTLHPTTLHTFHHIPLSKCFT